MNSTVTSAAATGWVASWSRNMQWAAVTTYLLATRVPPQNWPPLERRAATQGYLFFYHQTIALIPRYKVRYLQGWPRYHPLSSRISSLHICRLEINNLRVWGEGIGKKSSCAWKSTNQSWMVWAKLERTNEVKYVFIVQNESSYLLIRDFSNETKALRTPVLTRTSTNNRTNLYYYWYFTTRNHEIMKW